MIIEIDQSGKLEATNKQTVIAFSNGKRKSICISGKEKRELQEFFRRIGKPRMYIYRVFAILIFLLIRDELKGIDGMVIDREYPGWDHLIKDFLLREIRRIRANFDPHCISFHEVGKQSGSHFAAYGVNCMKKEPDITVRADDVLRHLVN